VTPVAWLLAVLVVAALAAVTASGPSWRRVVALVLVAPTAAFAYFMPAGALFERALAALYSILMFMRVLDLATERGPMPWWQRALHCFSLADTRRFERGPRQLHVSALGWLAFYAALGTGAVALLHLVDGNAAPWAWGLRWLAGCALIYAVMDATAAAARLIHHALGLRTRLHLQNAPILSRSLGEFWGRRWNGPVSRWLSAHCFWPLARRGHARWGLLAAFAWSALVHFLPVLASLGWRPAFGMAGFFLLQAVLVAAERPLRLVRWPRWAQHIWTIAGVLGPCPLFLEPVLTAIGLPAPGPLLWMG